MMGADIVMGGCVSEGAALVVAASGRQVGPGPAHAAGNGRLARPQVAHPMARSQVTRPMARSEVTRPIGASVVRPIDRPRHFRRSNSLWRARKRRYRSRIPAIHARVSGDGSVRAHAVTRYAA